MTSDPFRDLRDQEFREVKGRGYLNAASLGPMPARARAAMRRHLEARGAVHRMKDTDFTTPPHLARERAARLIGATPAEIALGPNTSFGINLAALGLDLPPGSPLVVSDREFPANVYPWMNRPSYRLEIVPTDANGWPDEDRLLETIARSDVSALAISSVQFSDGYRADLDRLGRECRDNGVFFIVDAIQSIGVLPVDVRSTPVDVLATGGHKWLCGPFGSGFVYVRAEVQERLAPVVIGWSSMEAAQNFDRLTDYDWGFLPDARRYEVGTPPVHDQSGLAESLELMIAADPAKIFSWVDELLAPLRRWLAEHPEVEVVSSLEERRRSGILAFRMPNLREVYRMLRSAGVVVTIREGTLRISAHLYNLPEDIARVLEVLDGRTGRDRT